MCERPPMASSGGKHETRLVLELVTPLSDLLPDGWFISIRATSCSLVTLRIPIGDQPILFRPILPESIILRELPLTVVTPTSTPGHAPAYVLKQIDDESHLSLHSASLALIKVHHGV